MKKRRIVTIALVALLAALCVLPVVSQALTVRREFAEIINVDHWCNMRAKPTVESEIVAQVNRGDSVILLCWNEDETWCFVDYNGKLGWINVKFLKPEGLKDVEVLGPAAIEVKPTAKPTVEPEITPEPEPTEVPPTPAPTDKQTEEPPTDLPPTDSSKEPPIDPPTTATATCY